MLNLLAKIKPALSSEGASAQLADLRARGEAAKARVNAAHDAFEAAVQRAAAGEGSWDDVAAARTTLLDARVSRRLLTKTADLADAHHAAAQKAAAKDREWKATIEASKRREKIADRLQAQLADVAASYAELHKANRAVAQAMPEGFPWHSAAGFGLEVDLAPSLVRVEYSRRGLPGGPPLLGIEPQLLADRYRGATQCIEHERAKAQEAASNG